MNRYFNLSLSLFVLSFFAFIYPHKSFAVFYQPTFDALQTYGGIGDNLTVAAGDLNGDDYQDLVVGRIWYDVVTVFVNDSTGHFTMGATYAGGNGPYDVKIADMNGDNHNDIVVVSHNYDSNGAPSYGDNLSVLLNNGDGTFAPKQSYGTTISSRSLALGDVDNDGDLDAVTVQVALNSLAFYTNDGNGVLTNETFYQRTNVGTFRATHVIMGDVNNDGHLDLAVSDGNDGAGSIFLNDSTGNFPSEQVYQMEFNLPNDNGDLSIVDSDLADLNGDGYLDWILANRVAQKITYLYNQGDGTFAQRMDCNFTYPGAILVRDFNNDSILDVVAVNQRASVYNSVSMLFGLPDGRYTNQLVVPMGGAATGLDVGNFNNDAYLDLATANYFGNTMTAKLIDGLTISNLDTTGASCKYLPNINSLSPSSVYYGASDFILTVNGDNFKTNSQIYWNGSVRTTTYVSEHELTAQIVAADVVNPQTVNVYVRNAGELGVSNYLPFVVKDNQAPICSLAVASPNLVTMNNQFTPVTISGVTDPDGDTIILTVDTIFQDEHTGNDIDAQGLGTNLPQIRAQRDGNGDGRVYHISFTTTDDKGASCNGEITVGVPHNPGNQQTAPVDGGSLYNSTQLN